MKATFYPSINSKCSMCNCDLNEGGYLIRDSKDNIIKTLCPICKDTEESIDNVTKVKRGKIVLRRCTFNWYAFWVPKVWGEHYEIISSKNLLLKDNILSHSEVVSYLDNPNVDVEIKR